MWGEWHVLAPEDWGLFIVIFDILKEIILQFQTEYHLLAFVCHKNTLLVFHRKDLCEAKHEMQSVFKFSDVLFALKSDVPP